jgi:hypothetical protein
MEYSTLVLPPQAEECPLRLRFRDTSRRTDCFDDVSPDVWERAQNHPHSLSDTRRFSPRILP